MTRARALPLLLAAGGALALPAATGATVVVQDSIAGVRIGMQMDEAKAILGEPKGDRVRPDEIQGSIRQLDYGLTDVTGSTGRRGTVQSITTTSRKQRTKDGIGVGSTKAALRAKVKRARCSGRVCVVGQELPGKRVTVFDLDGKGRVARITLSLVID